MTGIWGHEGNIETTGHRWVFFYISCQWVFSDVQSILSLGNTWLTYRLLRYFVLWYGGNLEKNNKTHFFYVLYPELQRSKLTFSKSRLLATLNYKMVAIKRIQLPKTKKHEGEDTSWHVTRREKIVKGRTLHDILHDRLMLRMAHFEHFTSL